MNKFLLIAVLFLASCASQIDGTPNWYISSKQNDAQNLYGTGQGFTLEEATKYALADLAARLMVSISSESNLIREENQTSTNEEMRQQVRQNVEKLSFSNFRVIKSEKLGQNFFVEVQVDKPSFLDEQKERVSFLEKKVADLDNDSLKKNPIQRRNSLIKILDLSKELELKSRILAGAGEDVKLSTKLARLAKFQNELDKTSDKIEFYFDINSPKEIAQIIRSSLNKEKIKISPNRSAANPNQIVIKIKSNSRSNKIYEAFMTKLQIDFENLAEGIIISSNRIEITGSSSISENESYLAALKALEEKIEQDGVLKTVGIIN